MARKFTVTFPVHCDRRLIASVLTGFGAYGNVFPTESDLTYSVEVSRASNLPKLKEKLKQFELHTPLHWTLSGS